MTANVDPINHIIHKSPDQCFYESDEQGNT